MKANNIRHGYNLKSNIANFFNTYKLILCVAFLMLVLGLIFGIVTANKYSSDLKLDNLTDSGLVDLIKGNKSVIGLFVSYLLAFLGCFCVIVFFNFKPWLNAVTFFVLIVRGYLIGFDITVLILVFGFVGIINVVLIILPFELLVWCVLILLCAFSIKRCRITQKYGCYNVNYTKVYCLLLIVGCLTLLLKCLLMPVIRVTIIVS